MFYGGFIHYVVCSVLLIVLIFLEQSVIKDDEKDKLCYVRLDYIMMVFVVLDYDRLGQVMFCFNKLGYVRLSYVMLSILVFVMLGQNRLGYDFFKLGYVSS